MYIYMPMYANGVACSSDVFLYAEKRPAQVCVCACVSVYKSSPFHCAWRSRRDIN